MVLRNVCALDLKQEAVEDPIHGRIERPRPSSVSLAAPPLSCAVRRLPTPLVFLSFLLRLPPPSCLSGVPSSVSLAAPPLSCAAKRFPALWGFLFARSVFPAFHGRPARRNA